MGDQREPPARREQDRLWEYRFDEVKEDIKELRETKATVEAIKHIEREIEALRSAFNKDVADLKLAFNDLKKIMIGAALSWVAGSGMFLLAVYQFRGGK